jgi:hypothetical protein
MRQRQLYLKHHCLTRPHSIITVQALDQHIIAPVWYENTFLSPFEISVILDDPGKHYFLPWLTLNLRYGPIHSHSKPFLIDCIFLKGYFIPNFLENVRSLPISFQQLLLIPWILWSSPNARHRVVCLLND